MTLSLESTFIQHFTSLEDPRVERTKHHLLIDIIAIAILAVISGADGWVAIETYGQAKQEWLASFLSLGCALQKCGIGSNVSPSPRALG